LEIRAVILSAAKDLFGRLARSFAALRMTARTPLKSAHLTSSSFEEYYWWYISTLSDGYSPALRPQNPSSRAFIYSVRKV